MNALIQAWPAIKRRLQEKTTWLGLFALVEVVNRIAQAPHLLAAMSSPDTAVNIAAAFGLIFAADSAAK